MDCAKNKSMDLIESKIGVFVPLSLSFFNDSGDKTEKATPKKKEKAREEGQVAKSTEITTAFLFLVIFMSLGSIAPAMFTGMREVFYTSISFIPEMGEFFVASVIKDYVVYLFGSVVLIVLPIFALSMGVGIITNVAQVGFRPSLKPLMPKFSKLNPASGFKKIFSAKSIVELIKSLAKFGIIGNAVYGVLMSELDLIFGIVYMDLMDGVASIGGIVIKVGTTVGGWYLVIALVDVVYQRFSHTKQLKMSKEEVRQEHKTSEGNPQIKGQIKQRMREASMGRMMADVSGADVVVTNPTHYAVALKYEMGGEGAPRVLAKGVDSLALRIKEVAKESNVTIVEDKPLARALYASVKVGGEIPEQLYGAVAEILAYVYGGYERTDARP